jgi:hypothetical protein
MYFINRRRNIYVVIYKLHLKKFKNIDGIAMPVGNRGYISRPSNG